MLHQLATIGLGPLLVAQGRRVRRTTPRLPEAAGARSGVVGQGSPLSILVLGDSAAAGVGAPRQEDALAGRLVSELATRHGVTWLLEAKTGATTASTLRRLDRMSPQAFDVAVTSLGVNDVVAAVGLREWSTRQRQLRGVLRESFGVRRLIVSGLPPMSGFPALPQPLRWYLGRRARQFDRVLERDLAPEDDATYLALNFAMDPGLMASDGYHPGPAIYHRWAHEIARVILSSGTAPVEARG